MSPLGFKNWRIYTFSCFTLRGTVANEGEVVAKNSSDVQNSKNLKPVQTVSDISEGTKAKESRADENQNTASAWNAIFDLLLEQEEADLQSKAVASHLPTVALGTLGEQRSQFVHLEQPCPSRKSMHFAEPPLDSVESSQREGGSETKRRKQAGRLSRSSTSHRNSFPLNPSEERKVLEQVRKVRLRQRGGESIRAETLWQETPALLLLLRRPGCVTCRAQSLKLEQIKDRLDALGVRRVAIVHEWLEAEIEAYTRDFWSGEVYLDPGREFYRVLGGGEIKQGKLVDFLNPRSKLWKNIAAAQVIMKGQPSNFKGDFMTLGGLIIVRPGLGGIQYMFREEVFGDPFRIKLILDECMAAAGQSVLDAAAMPASDGGAAMGSMSSGISSVHPLAASLELPRNGSHGRPSFNWAHPSLRTSSKRLSAGGSKADIINPPESTVASSPKSSLERDIARVAIALKSSLYAVTNPKPNI